MPVPGGGRIELVDGSSLEFQATEAGGFLGEPEAQRDPVADLGEAFKLLVHHPQALLTRAPGKFLMLNAEANLYPPADVRAMALATGVDLPEVLTSLAVAGRVSPETLARVSQHHGIRLDVARLRASEQRILAQGGDLEALTRRLRLDLGTRGPGTLRDLQTGQAILQAYRGEVARMQPVGEAAAFGLPASQRRFPWLAGVAQQVMGLIGNASAPEREFKAQFQALPLAAQLRVSPELALGATWFRLSPEEKATLRDPVSLQGLVAAAAETLEETGYVPQRLNASEKRALAVRTLIDALLDTGRSGAQLRSRLGSDQEPLVSRALRRVDPLGALQELSAPNGESVTKLLDTRTTAQLTDKRLPNELKAALTDPSFRAALTVLGQESHGADQLRAAVTRFAIQQGAKDADPLKVVQGLVQAIQQEQQRFIKSLDGGALELSLSEVSRQVREGNTQFVRAWLQPGAGALEKALGPWVSSALSTSERKLLEDPDYRRHVLEESQHDFVTGTSLAEEARLYRIQTENLQEALDLLTRPDNAFRREFAADPVGSLVRRGIYPHLPVAVQEALADGGKVPKLGELVRAIERTLSPLAQKQLAHQREWENLRRAIGSVNAGNYRPILGILDMGEDDLTHHVQTTLTSAMTHGDKEIRGGIIRFL
ncbi:MAG: hypothetical protein VKP62_12505 [Candidatus Sericytochromatia bacterium]|nr:hypothetical protein [Candidatus Sericytochromatia bacterium]